MWGWVSLHPQPHVSTDDPNCDSTLRPCRSVGNSGRTIGASLLTSGRPKNKARARRALSKPCRSQRPSSNTTSMLTDSVLSPGETDVPASALSIAIIRTIGIGGWKPPPSLMLTILRTCRPSALA